MRSILIALMVAVHSNAALLISPFEAMTQVLECKKVDKKNILLSKKEAKVVENEAKFKLKSNIFRIYIAKCDNEVKGYGVLVSDIVRTKNAAILYIFNQSGKLKSTQVIAFNEPLEYLPSKNWLLQLQKKNNIPNLRVGKNVSAISGATLTARMVVNGARVANSVFNIIKSGNRL